MNYVIATRFFPSAVAGKLFLNIENLHDEENVFSHPPPFDGRSRLDIEKLWIKSSPLEIAEWWTNRDDVDEDDDDEEENTRRPDYLFFFSLPLSLPFSPLDERVSLEKIGSAECFQAK